MKQDATDLSHRAEPSANHVDECVAEFFANHNHVDECVAEFFANHNHVDEHVAEFFANHVDKRALLNFLCSTTQHQSRAVQEEFAGLPVVHLGHISGIVKAKMERPAIYDYFDQQVITSQISMSQFDMGQSEDLYAYVEQALCQQEMKLQLPPNQEWSVAKIGRNKSEYNPAIRGYYLRDPQLSPQTRVALIREADYCLDVESKREMELHLPPNQEWSVAKIWRNKSEYNPAIRGYYLRDPQLSPQTRVALIGEADYCLDVEPQISESVGLEVGLSGRTNHQIPLPEHRTGSPQGDIAVDVEAQMSDEVNPPLNNIDPFSGFEMSPPQSTEQSTGTVEYIVDPIFSLIGSNRIRRLKFLAGCNLVSNTAVGVYNLLGYLDGVDDTFWRAQLIASVGAPIAVSVCTLLSSFRFASDPERWSDWITGLSSVNGGMIAGGPLAFYFMRNRSTQ